MTHPTTRSVLSISLGACLAIAGCGARASTTATAPRLQAEVALPQAAISADQIRVEPLEQGVTVSAPSCTEGAYDVCNGLDDDCDARIDEGCGWESGSVQITLAWDTAADLDLYVVDPDGYTISYMDPVAPAGGHVDHDARGACVPGSDTVENAFWDSPTPPRGRYMVDVHYWGECGITGPTPARLSISVAGRILGVYDFTLSPGQRQSIAVFTL